LSRLIALGVLLVVSLVASAAEQDGETTGVEVGKKAPDFELRDQSGKLQNRYKLQTDGPVAIVFDRSAAWWPFCQGQLVQLQKVLKSLAKEKIQLAAVSYDSVEVMSDFTRKPKITFPLLSDPQTETIEAYEIQNKEAKGSRIDGVPYPPGPLLVGPDGVVHARLFYDGYVNRHQAKGILKAAETLPQTQKAG